MQHDRHARAGTTPAVGDPMIGRVLDGRYRVGGRIARGGMASVYEATDLRLERTVAVKIMHAGLGDDQDFAQRFVREARAAARLSHPNVVGVYDQGEDDGVVFLAMELVPGHTLRDTIAKESPMPAGRALALIDPVLSALGAAHRAGLIHRDVKPENVLLSDDGRIKVADFGLAKAVSADTQHTATQGVLIGTVSYLAPELVVDGLADARADVYAVGVLLYELLTGVKPHEGESPIQVAYKHVHHDVPPPSARVPGLPAYVDALVARATARDRSLRPADAAVLLHQVHRVSQALASGVEDDPELTLDLRPVAATVDPDTTPEIWDEAEMEALLAAEPTGAEHTTAFAAQPPAPSPPAEPPTTRAPAEAPARPAPSRRSRKGPLLVVLALVLALGAGGGAYWFGWARYTQAPGVIGISQADAERRLTDAGLEFEYADEVYSREFEEGAVADSDPGGGARVLPGDTVTLTLSLGPLVLPKLKGITEDAAQDRLQDVQLRFGDSVERFSETVPEGTVLRSTPKAGTTLRPGATVDLVVSKGRRPIKVGRLVGKEVDDVRTKLDKRGLVANVVSEEFNDDQPEGVILEQDPPAGETLFGGGSVDLTVSKGPELVAVPSVRGFGVDAAEQELRDAGFDVEIRRDDDFISIGFVLRTDPDGGEMLPRGSTVTMIVV